MKLGLVIFTMLFFIKTKGQPNISTDSLSRYSYFIYGDKNGNTIEQGTGFFLRASNDKLFFVTTAHLITSWNYRKNKRSYSPIKTFYVRLFNKTDTSIYFFPINAYECTKTLNRGYAFQYPDLCFIETGNLADKYFINEIRINEKNYPIKDEIEDIIIFGYPVNKSLKDRNKYMELPPSKSAGELGYDYSKKLYWLKQKKYDSLNYQISIATGECKGGMSGSPVFYEVNGKVLFGGMCILGDEVNRYLYALRPEYIINELENRAKKM